MTLRDVPRPVIDRLRVRGLLSFGPEAADVVLGPLNILIGPNASGKSNLVDVLSLLAALPGDRLREALRDGGGGGQWLWKGPWPGPRRASIHVHASLPGGGVTHEVGFEADGVSLSVAGESVGDGARTLAFLGTAGSPNRWRSALAGPDPSQPDVVQLAALYAGIRVYREWDLGRAGVLRTPQPADLEDDFLLPSARNLAVILNALQRFPRDWDKVGDAMRRFHPGFEEVKTIVQGGTVQVFLRERGLDALVPASRLSDGTLRYLALLAVLVHPEPPALVCIEEPEQGLHPDLIDDLARLLTDAATRTQLVVTTHSDHLVNALSSSPEAVRVTERTDRGTEVRSLDAAGLEPWLERYRLGELWMNGELGGTRW